MGQRCGGLPNVATPCRDPRVGACVCKHGDLWSLETEDEQDDAAHQVLDTELAQPSASAATHSEKIEVVTRHVESLPVPRGGIYTGQVREDGQPHGHGTQQWSDGTIYNGSWSSGAAHGRGKLAKSDGSGYEGNWIEGRKHGIGFERLVDQSEYRGEFVDGQKHGRGAFRWKGGASYSGEFCEDALQGEGVFLWGDGRSYRGQWVQSRMHGQGKFEWSDGKSFEGKYESDKKHGPGIFTWPDGSNCVGIWQNGKQHGIGTHVNCNGAARKGRWKGGNLEQWLDPPQEAQAEARGPEGASQKMGSSSIAAPVSSGGDDKSASNGIGAGNVSNIVV